LNQKLTFQKDLWKSFKVSKKEENSIQPLFLCFHISFSLLPMCLIWIDPKPFSTKFSLSAISDVGSWSLPIRHFWSHSLAFPFTFILLPIHSSPSQSWFFPPPVCFESFLFTYCEIHPFSPFTACANETPFLTLFSPTFIFVLFSTAFLWFVLSSIFFLYLSFPNLGWLTYNLVLPMMILSNCSFRLLVSFMSKK